MSKKRLEYISILILAFFSLLFASWTIASHAAIFFKVPWMYLNNFAFLSILLVSFIFIQIAMHFAHLFCIEVDSNKPIRIYNNNPVVLVLLGVICSLLFLVKPYYLKYLLFITGSFTLFIPLSQNNKNQFSTEIKTGFRTSSTGEYVFLLIILIASIVFTLCANRSDLDDCSFLQITFQTLAHPELAPLSYDVSLGQVLNEFRFAPYKLSSYEILVSLLASWTGINIYNIYYIILPAISAGLTILVAFIFARCFFGQNTDALLATSVFLILMLAWGDTHYAYGNRVFVRLFQGKSLIVALTTPLSIITGLMLIRKPTSINLLMLSVSNICAIGVSSSGLIISIFTSILLCFLSISQNVKKTAVTILLICVSMIYPIIIALLLKFQTFSNIPLNEIGTYLPINASLGSHWRESCVLASLILGFSLYLSNANPSLSMVTFLTVFFILNPWISNLVSDFSAKNMSWRLAWAAPIPLLVSVSLIASIKHPIRTQYYKVAPVLSVIILFIFLFTNAWVVSYGNNIKFGFPSSKLPADFHNSNQIVSSLRQLNIKGSILAHRDIASWLPILYQSKDIVMPGHTFPTQLQTILSEADFSMRMKLYQSVNSATPKLENFSKELRALNVECVIIPIGIDPASYVDSVNDAKQIRVIKIKEISGYALFKIFY